MNNNILYKRLAIFILLFHLGVNFLYCVYIACFTTTLGGDTLEHMHSSWLVYANFIPYKDFFQHHNPLLWYMFSPIVGLHAQNVSDNFITSFVILSSIVISFINFYYLYLIVSRFLSSKTSGVLASSIALTPYVLLSIIHFRPDNYMLASFFAGLYYYFCYLENKKVRNLSISFLLYWCSFMFLQKIVFTLLLIGIITIYLLIKKDIHIKDFIKALIGPLLLSLIFLAHLYNNNIINVWYHSNFTFNLYIPNLFDSRRVGFFWPELKLLLIGAGCAIIFCLKKSNKYFKILCIIFISELFQRYFYFSAFAYYFCLLIYISSMLTATFLSQKVLPKFYFIIYIISISLCVCMYKPSIYQGNIGEIKSRFHKNLQEKIFLNINPCDYVLNGDGSIYNIYNRDPHYYWNLLGQLDVIGDKVGIHPLMDINKVIEQYKPRIISITPYKDKYSSERGLDLIVHNPDMVMINKYYKPYNNSDTLYIRKPEYSNVNCKFDYKKRYYYSY